MAAESVLVAGGGAAILLQIADERVGLGVAQHSDFASRPLDRLHATLRYVYVQVYGTGAERRFVSRAVNRAHRPVRADAADGRPAYSAFDPQLQLWVAATLYRTALVLHERVIGPLDEKVADRVYRQYAVLGTGVGMPAALWPADRAAFETYWNESLAALEVSDEARRVARDLLHPRVGPVWLRAAMPLARLMTAGLLPESVRAAYRLPWSDARQRRFDAVISVTRLVWPRLSRGIRHLPAIRCLRQVRAEMREAAG
ncbi:Uncharacterized conserved protein, DUF2236 family [Paramicrobacterium humi]|uniref:Uncharacterized conserved protein, DUF2236 family n=2 Tax=Paramicrobacterium humi TaxID=640635 RepID=A0A1H4IZ39_9MICO|nr:Uncharacterized conserved protein, DUF2236 family [Microbacterium humi]